MTVASVSARSVPPTDVLAASPPAAVDRLSAMLVGTVADPVNVASALLAEFGTLGAVLYGRDARIRRAIGCQPRVTHLLRSIAEGMEHILLSRVEQRTWLGTSDALREYLCTRYGSRDIEFVRALYLNTRNHLLLDEEVSRGTVDQAQVHIREVIARALELGAAALVLVHNHPSGDPSPSSSDIALTKSLDKAARLFAIDLHDHIIVGGQDLISLRARCLF